MKTFKDLKDKIFGKLRVTRYAGVEPKYGEHLWECVCECGTVRVVTASSLLSKNTQSCGCTRRLNLIGKKFNRLKVVGFAGIKTNSCGKKFTTWVCRCDCGKRTIVSGTLLSKGKIQSCGCLNHDALVEAHTKYHNPIDKQLASIFSGMKDRCYNSNLSYYKWYGKRGIYICDEWLKDIWNFINWSKSSGYTPGLTIDRIDVNGPYAPWNCRWVTYKVQANNTTKNRFFTLMGCKKTIAQWADELNVRRKHFYHLKDDDLIYAEIKRLLEEQLVKLVDRD